MRARELIVQSTYFLGFLERRIHGPIAIIDENKIRGFRFGQPTIVHYVVINIARGLSILNAISELISKGYQGEAFILARTFMENDSKLSYVVDGLSKSGADKKTQKFIEEFFADNIRDPNKRSRYRGISQKDIHRRNSEKVSRDIEFLSKFELAQGVSNNDNRYEKHLSFLYNHYSNYVHGRYPEMMDIYGEKSTRIRTQGNFESKDVDYSIEQELLDELAAMGSKGLRKALMHLTIAGLIQFSDEEKSFCFEQVFES